MFGPHSRLGLYINIGRNLSRVGGAVGDRLDAGRQAGTAVGKFTIAPGARRRLFVEFDEQRDGSTLTAHGVLAEDGWWRFDS
jgi:hypothetical protein